MYDTYYCFGRHQQRERERVSVSYECFSLLLDGEGDDHSNVKRGRQRMYYHSHSRSLTHATIVIVTIPIKQPYNDINHLAKNHIKDNALADKMILLILINIIPISNKFRQTDPSRNVLSWAILFVFVSCLFVCSCNRQTFAISIQRIYLREILFLIPLSKGRYKVCELWRVENESSFSIWVLHSYVRHFVDAIYVDPM